MLDKQTQDKLLLVLAGNLSYIDRFKRKGIEITDELFCSKNKKNFKEIKNSKKLGYTTVTKKFIEEFELELPEKSQLNNDQFLDLLLEIRKQIESHYVVESKVKLKKAFKDYKNSPLEERAIYISKLAEVVGSIRTTNKSNRTKTAYEVVDNKFFFQEEMNRIPAFLQELDDDILLGGFSRRGIHVISGFPGNGKTTAAVQFGTLQATNGYKVLFLSLEQSEEDIISNLISVLSEEKSKGRSYWDVTKFTSENAKDKHNEAKKIISKYINDNFKVDDTIWDTQDQFVERVRRAAIFEGYDVIIIDNFQNVSKPKNFYQTEVAYSGLADKLLKIALHKENKSAILALSQLTKYDGQEKTKYSARLNEHAITHLKISRPKKTKDTIDHLDKIMIKSIKARNGKQNVAKTFNFIGSKSIIGSITLPRQKSDYGNL